MGLAILALLALAQAGPGGATPEIPIVGTILDDVGRPVPGAEVVLAQGATAFNSRAWFASPDPDRSAVLGRGRTDAEGGFRLALLVHGSETARRRRPAVIWAYRSGAALASRPIPDDWPRDGEPVGLTLGRPSPVVLRVLGPDGRPVAGARITPARVRGVPLPSGLADRLATRADADGRGTLDVAAPEDLDLIRIDAPASGTQQFRTPRPDVEGVRTLTLAPVGRVEGRVEADDPEATRGLSVRLQTVADPADAEVGAGGMAEVVTDDRGQFAVPAIAAGTLGLMFEPRRDLPFRGRFNDKPSVDPGASTRVVIPLERAALIRGVVRERGSGAPVAGAGVILESGPQAPIARTDAEGRYAAYALPGVLSPMVADIPRPYYFSEFFLDSQPVPDDAREFTLHPLELVRGAILDGRVVDPEGRPVPGAEVSGYWLRPARGYETVSAVSDRAGTFRIEGVDPKAEVLLSARRGAAVTATPVPARAEEGPVMLTVSPARAVAVSGRAVDPDGRPLAGAIVRIESRKRGPEDFEVEAGRVVFDADGRDTIRSDADGRFQTPRLLRPDLEYRARVEAEGRILARTEWIAAARSTAFPEVVLHPIEPTRTVEGRVVDRDGRPIAGAEVSQSGDGPRRRRTVADAEGRFRLPGLFRAPAFLFVAGEGLRPAGRRIEAADGPVVLSVRRAGDPPDPALRTLPPPLPRAEEKALALRLVEPDLERLTGKEQTRDMFALIQIVPRIDPARAQELAERNALPEPEYNDYLRLNAAQGLLEESPEEALAVAETIAKPSLHSRLVRLASDAVPASDRARKRELLEQALLIARAAPDPADRLEEFGLIGYRLLDLGETDRGAALLREGQRLAETLPKFDPGNRKAPAAHARGRFAAKLARIDARAAFALAEGFNDSYADWYIGGVALGLADRDPAGAERALGMMTWKNLRAIRTGRVAGRMVVKDPGRARRLVLALEDPLERTSGLAMMARGLAGSDPRAAAGLVDETLELLLQLAREGRDRPEDYHGSSITAVALLPVAERLDPGLLLRSFWEAVALRPPRPAGGDPDGGYEEATAKLALGLARYDRAVARQVLEPVAKRARSVNATGRAFRGHTLFAAAALIDPAWAVALIDALPDDPPGADVRPKALARRAMADVLAYGGADRWEHVEQMYLWLRGDSKDDEL